MIELEISSVIVDGVTTTRQHLLIVYVILDIFGRCFLILIESDCRLCNFVNKHVDIKINTNIN